MQPFGTIHQRHRQDRQDRIEQSQNSRVFDEAHSTWKTVTVRLTLLPHHQRGSLYRQRGTLSICLYCPHWLSGNITLRACPYLYQGRIQGS